MDVKICDFIIQDLKYIKFQKSTESTTVNGKTVYYFKVEFLDDIRIVSDIKICLKGAGVNFSFWANLWYSSLNSIKSHLDKFHKDLIDGYKNKNSSRIEKTIHGI
jgi:hypothetical protein